MKVIKSDRFNLVSVGCLGHPNSVSTTVGSLNHFFDGGMKLRLIQRNLKLVSKN